MSIKKKITRIRNEMSHRRKKIQVTFPNFWHHHRR